MPYGDKIGINDVQVGVASRENAATRLKRLADILVEEAAGLNKLADRVAHFNGPEEEALMRLIWRAERSYNG